MFPISIMMMLACATLIITLFFLDGNPKIEMDKEHKSRESIELTPDIDYGEGDKTNVKLSGNTSETETFKTLYNDEVVSIPIWRGRWKQAANAVAATNALPSISEKSGFQTLEEVDAPKTKGDAFGVEMKLFHYGGKPKQMISDEERSAKVLQKKNAMKDKWMGLAEKMKKRKIVKEKGTNMVTILSHKRLTTKDKASEKKNDVTNLSNKKLATRKHVPTTKEKVLDEIDDAAGIRNEDIKNDDDTSIKGIYDSDEELNDEIDDVLSIFDKVVDTGTAAMGTTLP